MTIFLISIVALLGASCQTTDARKRADSEGWFFCFSKEHPSGLGRRRSLQAHGVQRSPQTRPGPRSDCDLHMNEADGTNSLLKTDIQGLDLKALKSAGDPILRVKRIQTEIMNTALYEKTSAESMSSEQEFQSYLGERVLPWWARRSHRIVNGWMHSTQTIAGIRRACWDDWGPVSIGPVPPPGDSGCCGV